VTETAEHSLFFECRYAPKVTYGKGLLSAVRWNHICTVFHFTPFGENKKAAVPLKVLIGKGLQTDSVIDQQHLSFHCK